MKGNETLIFQDIRTHKEGVFEHYFKARNNLQSSAESNFAEVKFFKLEVIH